MPPAVVMTIAVEIILVRLDRAIASRRNNGWSRCSVDAMNCVRIWLPTARARRSCSAGWPTTVGWLSSAKRPERVLSTTCPTPAGSPRCRARVTSGPAMAALSSSSETSLRYGFVNVCPIADFVAPSVPSALAPSAGVSIVGAAAASSVARRCASSIAWTRSGAGSVRSRSISARREARYALSVVKLPTDTVVEAPSEVHATRCSARPSASAGGTSPRSAPTCTKARSREGSRASMMRLVAASVCTS